AGRPQIARRPAHTPRLGPCVPAAGAERAGAPGRAAAGGRRAGRIPGRRRHGLHADAFFARPGQPDAVARAARWLCLADQAGHYHSADQIHAGERVSVPKMRLALFDLDHTLLPIDADYAWGVFTQDLGWCDPVLFKERNDEFFEHYKAGTLDIRDYVRFATEAIRLRGPVEAEAAHTRFMQTVIGPAIRSEALELVRRHRAAGEQLVIVTATNEFVTRPIARAF